MGVNLVLTGSADGEHATDLCTNGGWTALCEWLDSLPMDRFPAAHTLSAEEAYTPTDELAEQLETAFAELPPNDPDTRRVADRLLDLLGSGRPNETVTIES